MLITGYNNSVVPWDDISIDQFLLLFLHFACDYSYFIYGIIVFIMIEQINEQLEDGLKSSPETSRYTEKKWIGRKNQNELYFLHLIDKLNFDYLKNKKISQSEIRNNFSCFTSTLF